MKTVMKRLIAGVTFTALAGAFNGCAPVMVASRPRPVIYDPAPVPAPVPVQAVIVNPAVPVWAPPYSYVHEVHYYYFPDYMVYYDVFASSYCYYDGFSWLRVAVLPALPFYYGFSPYNSYIVVLNRSCHDPWMRHSYYTEQYPVGYYRTAYSPRTSLGSNTILRAYDENQGRPLFVDKRSNKEVAVRYDVVKTPRGGTGTNSADRNANTNEVAVRNTSRQSTAGNSTERMSPADNRSERHSNPNDAAARNTTRQSVSGNGTERMPAVNEHANRNSKNTAKGNNTVERNTRDARPSGRNVETQGPRPEVSTSGRNRNELSSERNNSGNIPMPRTEEKRSSGKAGATEMSPRASGRNSVSPDTRPTSLERKTESGTLSRSEDKSASNSSDKEQARGERDARKAR